MKTFIRDQEGQSIAEYCLILVCIGAAAAFMLMATGQNLNSIFSKIGNYTQSANEQIK